MVSYLSDKCLGFQTLERVYLRMLPRGLLCDDFFSKTGFCNSLAMAGDCCGDYNDVCRNDPDDQRSASTRRSSAIRRP